MNFLHPLARTAKVWTATPTKGKSERILVIVTTLSLDPKAKRYKKDMVKHLSAAAEAFLAENPKTAGGFMLVNRPRDWQARKDV